MINNLFSTFDPSTQYLSLAWASLLIPIAINPLLKLKKPSTVNLLKKIINNFIVKEINNILKESNRKGLTLIVISLFTFLSLRNIIAIAPFTFTPNAHIILTFPISIVIWVAIIIFGWKNNPTKIIAHTVPKGTPIALINFIVIVEVTRNIIRPITLSVRLSANIVAGHLLLVLLRNFALKISVLGNSPALVLLRLLEIGVAIIQAYVFITLMSLYLTEIHYERKISPLPHSRNKTMTNFSSLNSF